MARCKMMAQKGRRPRRLLRNKGRSPIGVVHRNQPSKDRFVSVSVVYPVSPREIRDCRIAFQKLAIVGCPAGRIEIYRFARGMTTTILVPPPPLGSALMLPPRDSTMDRTRARPIYSPAVCLRAIAKM